MNLTHYINNNNGILINFFKLSHMRKDQNDKNKKKY